jgi:DNA polymerase-2
MAEHTGWLLDLYPDPLGGLTLWLAGEDRERRCPKRQRWRLWQDFPVTFYVAGPNERLRALWKFLQAQDVEVALSRTERRDLFLPQPVTVMAVQVAKAIEQPALFAQVARAFPTLTYYDADLAITLRHAATFGTFPLARVQVTADERGRVQSIQVLDSPWELDPSPAPLQVMTIQPDCDPHHATPQSIRISFDRYWCHLSLSPWRPLLINLSAILRRHDPDLLLTDWGDTWLLPYLLDLRDQHGFALPFNRDERMDVTHKKERSYQAYGQVIHRGRQVHLFGRWHIDRFNAMMYHGTPVIGHSSQRR